MDAQSGNHFDQYDDPQASGGGQSVPNVATAGNHFDQYDQQAPIGKPTYDPTEGMSGVDKFAAGAGKSVVDTGRGIYQLGASLGHAMGVVSDDKMQKIQSDIDESKQRDAPLMNTGAGMAGNVAGGIAQFAAAPELMPAKLAAMPMLANAAAGAGVSALQPTATGESRGENAALGGVGGAAGSMAGKGLEWLAQPIKHSLGAGAKAAADALQKAGIPLDLAQQTGSRVVQTIKNVIADNPLIGHSAFPEEQGNAFNRAALRTMGITDPAVTAADPATMAAGKKGITDAMDEIGARTKIKYDQPLEDRLTELEKEAPGRVSADNLGMVRSQINNVMSSAAENNGVIPGPVYQKLRSQLGDLSADPSMAPMVEDIQEAVDDAFHRSVSPKDATDLGTARQHYRAMKQIEKSVNPESGNINPATLINRINTAGNRNQALYGKGDQSLVELAKNAKTIIGQNNPNSGTARRLAGMAAMGAIAGGTSEAMHGDPREALKVGAIGAALPWAGRQLIENPAVVQKALRWNASPAVKAATGAARKGIAAAVPAVTASENQPDIPRASGGRVDTEMLVNRLINRWKAAKVATNESTKSLLKVPDNSIAKALEIAGNSI